MMRKRFTKRNFDVMDLIELLSEKNDGLNDLERWEAYLKMRLEEIQKEKEKGKDDKKKPDVRKFSPLEVLGLILFFGPPVVLMEAYFIMQMIASFAVK